MLALFLQRQIGMVVFRDRRDAGAQLAMRLQAYAERPDVIVLALPRGGVPVGYEVAMQLAVPLDVMVVRKIGVPAHSELAMGAIASGGARVVDHSIVDTLDISYEEFEGVVRLERRELERREHVFRGDRAPLDLVGRTVILVDDGLATGSTMLAAVAAVRSLAAAAVVVAVPVAPPQACAMIGAKVDDIVCLYTPERFRAVGIWYEDFAQTTDEEVRGLLAAADRALRISPVATAAPP